MARPLKRTLSYSTWDVGVLENDTTIDKLVDAQGPAGFYVYFGLCQRAYATEGYFYRWGYDDAPTTARKLGGGLSAAQVRSVVDACLKLGLFDMGLFSRHGILTSRAIQRRYIDGIARRRESTICTDFWLLEAETAPSVVFVPLNQINVYKNPCFEQQKPSYCAVNKIKQNEMNPQHNPPKKPDVENRKAICTKLLALLQSYTGESYVGNKPVRQAVYHLMDRKYTERDIRAVIQMACYEYREAGGSKEKPLDAMAVFGADFDRLVATPAALDVTHSEWRRDHYSPLPPKRNRGGF